MSGDKITSEDTRRIRRAMFRVDDDIIEEVFFHCGCFIQMNRPEKPNGPWFCHIHKDPKVYYNNAQAQPYIVLRGESEKELYDAACKLCNTLNHALQNTTTEATKP